ncbi:MAG: hypothetical protein M3Q73_00660 [bacterium]|nr:hypothetical protein [bacterium]
MNKKISAYKIFGTFIILGILAIVIIYAIAPECPLPSDPDGIYCGIDQIVLTALIGYPLIGIGLIGSGITWFVHSRGETKSPTPSNAAKNLLKPPLLLILTIVGLLILKELFGL